jgi:hypothetical protein
VRACDRRAIPPTQQIVHDARNMRRAGCLRRASSVACRDGRTFLFTGALPQALLHRVRAEANEAHRLAASEASSMPIESQGTHWLEPGAAPRCAIEEAVAALRLLALGADAAALDVGCEWWVQKRLGRDNMHFHFDTDMCLQHRTGVLRTPWLSSVLYFSSHGGPTAILEQHPGDGWFGRTVLAPSEPDAVDLIFPRANAYGVFAGDRLHGVLPGEGGGERLTLLVNYWRGGKPDAPCCDAATDARVTALADAADDDVQTPAAGEEGAPAEPALCESVAFDLSKRRDLADVHVEVVLGAAAGKAVPRRLETTFWTVDDVEGDVRRAGLATLEGMGRVRLLRSCYDY